MHSMGTLYQTSSFISLELTYFSQVNGTLFKI